MKTENEVLERYLQNMVPPECESAGHQGRLRAELLARVERRQAGGMLRGRWKTPMLVLGLVAVAAAGTEVAVQVHRYYFEGRSGDDVYVFSTAPQVVYQGTYVDSQGVSHPRAVSKAETVMVNNNGKKLDAAGIEQKRQDLEEIRLLRQQNVRELLSVMDTAVNGHPQGRHFTYKYRLSGGRTEVTDDSEATSGSAQEQQQFQQQLEEARRQGRKEVINAMDTELDGQLQRTLICRYALPDGRVGTGGESDPNVASPAKYLTHAQQIELLGLVRQQQGTRLGRFEAPVCGQTFAFEKSAYRLADGTAVTYAEGKPKSPKIDLTGADWAELIKLCESGAGEPLAEYTAEVHGQAFLFKPVKYVLSDGTEVVRAPGQPVAVR